MLSCWSSRTATEQVELLRKVESRQIIKRVADDTATLRTVSRVDSLSISRGQPSVGSTEFEFDGAVLESNVYQRAGNMRPHPSRTEHRSIAGLSNQDVGGVDLGPGFEMGATPFSPDSLDPLVVDTGIAIGERPMRSNAKSLNRGDSTYSSLGSRSSGSKREKLRSMIRRFSSSGSFSPVTSPGADSPDGRRSRCRDFNMSIDLKTEDGRSAPSIVKAAQTGTRQDVERLIQSNHDIEKRHLQTRRNALLVASHCGKQDIVHLLIHSNANLEARDGTGYTALHLAASRGHVEVLEVLIVEGVDIDAQDTHGRTALWLAADLGQLDSVRILVAAQAKVNLRGHNQMTPFHVAAKRGDTEIVEHLMYNGAADIEAKDASMMTAFHYACEAGHVEVVDLLLSNKMDPNAPGSDGRSPLICAAALGRLHLVRLLLSKKASTRSIDDNGMTALHWAAFNGHTEIVQLLSQKKDSLSIRNVTGRTPLHVAVMAGQFGVVELLLRKENVALEARCAGGLTMLHYACLHNRPEIAHLLLASGCDIEAETNGKQQRPIHIAAESGSVKLIKLLCDKGASLGARNAMGDRALCVACRLGRASAVQVLLKEGSALCQQFGNQLHKDSPLCLAAMEGHVSVVALLVQHGACVDQADESGWQPVRYAAYYGHPRVLELLLANSTQSYKDFSADKIGFAPRATVPEDQKAQIRELLNQSTQQPRHSTISAGVITAPRPSPMSQTAFPFDPASFPPESPEIDNYGPYELPGTLEQGLPVSRSHTPEQMRGNASAQATHVVGPSDPQQAVPTPFESRSTVPTTLKQPRAVSASAPWIDRIHTQVDALPSTQPAVPVVPAAPPAVSLTLSQLALHNQATGCSYSTPSGQQSEISSVASVYTAPETGSRAEAAPSHS